MQIFFNLTLIFAAMAALVHIYIFVLESIKWQTPRVQKVFGTTEGTSKITAPLAFNQGFYNLFLAIITLVGIGYSIPHRSNTGVVLIISATASMFAAATVLIISDKSKSRAAIVQGLFPFLSLVYLAMSSF